MTTRADWTFLYSQNKRKKIYNDKVDVPPLLPLNQKHSLARVLGEQSQLPGQVVIATRGLGVTALVQVLHLARVNRHSLVDIRADNLAVAEVLSPGLTALELDVVGADKGVLFRIGQAGPLSIQSLGGP